MPLTAERLDKVRQTVVRQDTYSLLTKLLIDDAISSLERKVYRYLCKYPGITSRTLADQFGIEINQIGNILSKLRLLNLIEGTIQTEAPGLHYEWYSKPEPSNLLPSE